MEMIEGIQNLLQLIGNTLRKCIHLTESHINAFLSVRELPLKVILHTVYALLSVYEVILRLVHFFHGWGNGGPGKPNSLQERCTTSQGRGLPLACQLPRLEIVTPQDF